MERNPMSYFERLTKNQISAQGVNTTKYKIMNQFVQQVEYEFRSKVWINTSTKVRIQIDDRVRVKVREQIWEETQ
jgi:DNA-directed RNA polymerase subunit E'/Rpb7